jgi:stage II sporulation protein R
MKGLAVFLLIAVGVIAVCCNAYSKNVQKGISDGVIRFHVLANSDDEEDQRLKLKVRDEVLSCLEAELSTCESREETVGVIESNLDKIQLYAENVVKDNGYDYPVKVEMSRDTFPTKKYGDVTLPAGEYDALRIEIGKAEGHNWWCVMFPPLCYVDITKNESPQEDKRLLKENMSDEEYSIITSDTTEVKLKFKIIELLNSI